MKPVAAIEKAGDARLARQAEISLTDPHRRPMATSGRGSVHGRLLMRGIAVDTTNHLIVAHEVNNVGSDRSQLATMAGSAKAALRSDNRTSLRIKLL